MEKNEFKNHSNTITSKCFVASIEEAPSDQNSGLAFVLSIVKTSAVFFSDFFLLIYLIMFHKSFYIFHDKLNAIYKCKLFIFITLHRFLHY